MHDAFGKPRYAVIGSYQLVQKLGSDPQGHTFLVEHQERSGKHFALKMMQDTPLPPVPEQEHILREIMQLQLLQHRHIAFILEYGIHQQQLFLVTSYADGGSLEQRLARANSRFLPVQEALTLVKQVGGALHFAHQRDILHANLKPENILFRANGEALLTDFRLFALARQTGVPARRSGQRYRAPEQLQFDQHTPASDQYTLALLAWEWLLGSPPFPTEVLERFARPLLTAQPALPRDLPDREVRQCFIEPLRTALASNPEDRYPSIKDFASALAEAYASSLPTVQSAQEPVPPPPATVLMNFRRSTSTSLKTPASSAYPASTAKLPTPGQAQNPPDSSLPPRRARRSWFSS
jgi:serine/threonine protein kinase